VKRSPSLFPEMDAEIEQDRSAAESEKVQHARGFLQGKDKIREWVKSRLEKRSKSDFALAFEIAELRECKEALPWAECLTVMQTMAAMHVVGELRRKEIPHHPSGEQAWLYSLPKQAPTP